MINFMTFFDHFILKKTDQILRDHPYITTLYGTSALDSPGMAERVRRNLSGKTHGRLDNPSMKNKLRGNVWGRLPFTYGEEADLRIISKKKGVGAVVTHILPPSKKGDKFVIP